MIGTFIGGLASGWTGSRAQQSWEVCPSLSPSHGDLVIYLSLLFFECKSQTLLPWEGFLGDTNNDTMTTRSLKTYIYTLSLQKQEIPKN